MEKLSVGIPFTYLINSWLGSLEIFLKLEEIIVVKKELSLQLLGEGVEW